MSKLEKWLPFKFKKKTQQEKQAQPARQQPTETALTPFGQMPFPALSRLFDDRFFEDFFRDPFARFQQMDRWFGDFSPSRFVPSIEVSDEGKALKVTAELPGMEKDDVNLQVEDNMLVISGEKKSESSSDDEGLFRTERYYGYFQRAIPLPEDIDWENAEAEFKKGVLTVRFPKRETTSRGRRIEVR